MADCPASQLVSDVGDCTGCRWFRACRTQNRGLGSPFARDIVVCTPPSASMSSRHSHNFFAQACRASTVGGIELAITLEYPGFLNVVVWQPRRLNFSYGFVAAGRRGGRLSCIDANAAPTWCATFIGVLNPSGKSCEYFPQPSPLRPMLFHPWRLRWFRVWAAQV